MRGMETFTLVPRGPFSLAASIRFLEGFTPASYSSAPDGVLELAFPAEGSWRTVGVRVSQAGETVEAGIVSPAEPGADLVAEVRPQVERILSLDVDGSGFPAVGERDPVAGEVQRRYPDFSAGLTLLRGANAPDAVPSAEPRLARAIALAYGLPGPATPGQILQISENWRPYRTWVTLLLRTQLEYETGEIAGRQGHARTG